MVFYWMAVKYKNNFINIFEFHLTYISVVIKAFNLMNLPTQYLLFESKQWKQNNL